ncbi:MAG: hypothetical protein L7T81_08120, partial [Candidatus Poseidoniaceae archaeon]|nr:hypothetical protein [Candidatus Poseidoniaceae archaeon]
TYIELAMGDEFIPNGDPLMIDDLHTDAIDDAEDLNIIGVRMIRVILKPKKPVVNHVLLPVEMPLMIQLPV